MNPRAAINDLHPFQGCPFDLLGTSPNEVDFHNLYNTVKINLQRRGWDSNPRALADKRFSRPPRYDHFDTSPNAHPFAQRKIYINKKGRACQQLFSFFSYFFKCPVYRKNLGIQLPDFSLPHRRKSPALPP